MQNKIKCVTASSLKNRYILEISYEYMMRIQCESKHVGIPSDILFEIVLYLNCAFYFYFT